jgi:YVTN family beta-propeller protein
MTLLKHGISPASLMIIGFCMATPAAASTPMKVYVPLGNANSIVIVDAATNTVVGKITDVPNVHGLAATPDGKYLIAGRNDERAIGASAPSKPESVSDEEHAAHHPRQPATSSGTSATSSSKSSVESSLSLIRVTDRTLMRRIDVPGAVHHVAVSPEGRYAMVTHPTQGAVSLVDLKTYDVAATISTGPLPNYATFSPNGSRAYVSNAGNNTVSDIDVSRRIVLRNIVVGGSPEHLILSRDGNQLFVTNVNDGTVSAVDIRQGEVSKTYSVGSALHGIDLSDDEQTLFVASLGDDKIASINLASGEVLTARLAPAPYHLAVIHGAGVIYVSSADKPLAWVIDQSSLKIVSEIAIGGKGHQMVQIGER